MLSPFVLASLTYLAAPAIDTLPLRVSVDSARHEVLIEYRVEPRAPAASTPSDHGEHVDHDRHGGDHSDHSQRLLRFAWPLDGWLRGARVELEDASGARLSQKRLHHVNLLNFDRRQLVHPAVERLYAAGQESAPVMLPASVGIPMHKGMRLGVLAAFAPADLPPGSLIRLRIKWTPTRMNPRPIDVYPVLVDVGFRPGTSPAYDLPPGRSERTFVFTAPISGRILAAGGHMHDYGELLALEELGGDEIVVLESRLDPAGRMQSIPVRIFGAFGRGLPIRAGREYRMRVVYDNRTGRELRDGAMGEFALLFAPDRTARWPEVDHADPLIAADLEGLAEHERATH